MKFLVDHQLPPLLADFLEAHGHSAKHVRDIGLKEANDRIIWNHAVENEMALISKDEDFYFIAISLGATGKLVWVRIGNCRKRALLEVFEIQLPRIIEAFETGSRIVEIR